MLFSCIGFHYAIGKIINFIDFTNCRMWNDLMHWFKKTYTKISLLYWFQHKDGEKPHMEW